MVGPLQIVILIVFALFSAFISYNIAVARNRTGWKAALVGAALMIFGMTGIALFLKTKGIKNERKNKIFSGIVLAIWFLPILSYFF